MLQSSCDLIKWELGLRPRSSVGESASKQLLLPPTQMLPPPLALLAHSANGDTVGTAAGEEGFAVDVMITSRLFSFPLWLGNDIAVHIKHRFQGVC